MQVQRVVLSQAAGSCLSELRSKVVVGGVFEGERERAKANMFEHVQHVQSNMFKALVFFYFFIFG